MWESDLPDSLLSPLFLATSRIPGALRNSVINPSSQRHDSQFLHNLLNHDNDSGKETQDSQNGSTMNDEGSEHQMASIACYLLSIKFQHTHSAMLGLKWMQRCCVPTEYTKLTTIGNVDRFWLYLKFRCTVGQTFDDVDPGTSFVGGKSYIRGKGYM